MKKNDWIGCSEISLHEAIDDALTKAGDHSAMVVMETQSSQPLPNKRYYQVRVVTFSTQEGV